MPQNKKSKRKQIRKNKTIKKMPTEKNTKITNTNKSHIATDELYAKMQENVDRFVEVLLGKDESRIQMMEKRIDLLDMNSKEEFKKRLLTYRKFLTDMNIYFDESNDSDILNIRDELLADLNQFLYLFSFDKV